MYWLLCWLPHVASYGARAGPFCSLVKELLEASSDPDPPQPPPRQMSRCCSLTPCTIHD